MKRIISNIARLMPVFLVIAIVLLVADVMNEGTAIGEKLGIITAVVWVIFLTAFCISYLIHLVWMVKEHIKGDGYQVNIWSCLAEFTILGMIIAGLEIYTYGITWRLLLSILEVALGTVGAEISKYVYQKHDFFI